MKGNKSLALLVGVFLSLSCIQSKQISPVSKYLTKENYDSQLKTLNVGAIQSKDLKEYQNRVNDIIKNLKANPGWAAGTAGATYRNALRVLEAKQQQLATKIGEEEKKAASDEEVRKKKEEANRQAEEKARRAEAEKKAEAAKKEEEARQKEVARLAAIAKQKAEAQEKRAREERERGVGVALSDFQNAALLNLLAKLNSYAGQTGLSVEKLSDADLESKVNQNKEAILKVSSDPKDLKSDINAVIESWINDEIGRLASALDEKIKTVQSLDIAGLNLAKFNNPLAYLNELRALATNSFSKSFDNKQKLLSTLLELKKVLVAKGIDAALLNDKTIKQRVTSVAELELYVNTSFPLEEKIKDDEVAKKVAEYKVAIDADSSLIESDKAISTIVDEWLAKKNEDLKQALSGRLSKIQEILKMSSSSFDSKIEVEFLDEFIPRLTKFNVAIKDQGVVPILLRIKELLSLQNSALQKLQSDLEAIEQDLKSQKLINIFIDSQSLSDFEALSFINKLKKLIAESDWKNKTYAAQNESYKAGSVGFELVNKIEAKLRLAFADLMMDYAKREAARIKKLKAEGKYYEIFEIDQSQMPKDLILIKDLSQIEAWVQQQTRSLLDSWRLFLNDLKTVEAGGSALVLEDIYKQLGQFSGLLLQDVQQKLASDELKRNATFFKSLADFQISFNKSKSSLSVDDLVKEYEKEILDLIIKSAASKKSGADVIASWLKGKIQAILKGFKVPKDLSGIDLGKINTLRNQVSIVFNPTPGKKDEILQILEDVIADVINAGINKPTIQKTLKVLAELKAFIEVSKPNSFMGDKDRANYISEYILDYKKTIFDGVDTAKSVDSWVNSKINGFIEEAAKSLNFFFISLDANYYNPWLEKSKKILSFQKEWDSIVIDGVNKKPISDVFSQISELVKKSEELNKEYLSLLNSKLDANLKFIIGDEGFSQLKVLQGKNDYVGEISLLITAVNAKNKVYAEQDGDALVVKNLKDKIRQKISVVGQQAINRILNKIIGGLSGDGYEALGLNKAKQEQMSFEAQKKAVEDALQKIQDVWGNIQAKLKDSNLLSQDNLGLIRSINNKFNQAKKTVLVEIDTAEKELGRKADREKYITDSLEANQVLFEVVAKLYTYFERKDFQDTETPSDILVAKVDGYKESAKKYLESNFENKIEPWIETKVSGVVATIDNGVRDEQAKLGALKLDQDNSSSVISNLNSKIKYLDSILQQWDKVRPKDLDKEGNKVKQGLTDIKKLYQDKQIDIFLESKEIFLQAIADLDFYFSNEYFSVEIPSDKELSGKVSEYKIDIKKDLTKGVEASFNSFVQNKLNQIVANIKERLNQGLSFFSKQVKETDTSVLIDHLDSEVQYLDLLMDQLSYVPDNFTNKKVVNDLLLKLKKLYAEEQTSLIEKKEAAEKSKAREDAINKVLDSRDGQLKALLDLEIFAAEPVFSSDSENNIAKKKQGEFDLKVEKLKQGLLSGVSKDKDVESSIAAWIEKKLGDIDSSLSRKLEKVKTGLSIDSKDLEIKKLNVELVSEIIKEIDFLINQINKDFPAELKNKEAVKGKLEEIQTVYKKAQKKLMAKDAAKKGEELKLKRAEQIQKIVDGYGQAFHALAQSELYAGDQSLFNVAINAAAIKQKVKAYKEEIVDAISKEPGKEKELIDTWIKGKLATLSKELQQKLGQIKDRLAVKGVDEAKLKGIDIESLSRDAKFIGNLIGELNQKLLGEFTGQKTSVSSLLGQINKTYKTKQTELEKAKKEAAKKAEEEAKEAAAKKAEEEARRKVIEQAMDTVTMDYLDDLDVIAFSELHLAGKSTSEKDVNATVSKYTKVIDKTLSSQKIDGDGLEQAIKKIFNVLINTKTTGLLKTLQGKLASIEKDAASLSKDLLNSQIDRFFVLKTKWEGLSQLDPKPQIVLKYQPQIIEDVQKIIDVLNQRLVLVGLQESLKKIEEQSSNPIQVLGLKSGKKYAPDKILEAYDLLIGKYQNKKKEYEGNQSVVNVIDQILEKAGIAVVAVLKERLNSILDGRFDFFKNQLTLQAICSRALYYSSIYSQDYYKERLGDLFPKADITGVVSEIEKRVRESFVKKVADVLNLGALVNLKREGGFNGPIIKLGLAIKTLEEYAKNQGVDLSKDSSNEYFYYLDQEKKKVYFYLACLAEQNKLKNYLFGGLTPELEKQLKESQIPVDEKKRLRSAQFQQSIKSLQSDIGSVDKFDFTLGKNPRPIDIVEAYKIFSDFYSTQKTYKQLYSNFISGDLSKSIGLKCDEMVSAMKLKALSLVKERLNDVFSKIGNAIKVNTFFKLEDGLNTGSLLVELCDQAIEHSKKYLPDEYKILADASITRLLNKIQNEIRTAFGAKVFEFVNSKSGDEKKSLAKDALDVLDRYAKEVKAEPANLFGETYQTLRGLAGLSRVEVKETILERFKRAREAKRPGKAK